MVIVIQLRPTHEEEHRTFLPVLRHKCHNVPATCQAWKSHPTNESHQCRHFELSLPSSPPQKTSSKEKKCSRDEKGELHFCI